MSTYTITLPPTETDVRFVFNEKRHSSLPSSNIYREQIDSITLIKAGYQREINLSRYGYGPNSTTTFGPSSSYTPIRLYTANAIIAITIPQDLINNINNDRTQTYTKTVSNGITFPSQTIIISRLQFLENYWWTRKNRDGTQTSGVILLTTTGQHQITGDTVDLTIDYKPQTVGSNFYYTFTYTFDYSPRILCQVNGRI